jgi:alpha-1,3/alpha-1,6-mannosyltransferase
LEEKTTGMADVVLVNSKFTSNIFHDTFKSLGSISPGVLYPSLNFSSFDRDVSNEPPLSLFNQDDAPPVVFLSINRYERKKNLSLAVTAFENVLGSLEESERERVHLILAGGYDERVTENKEYYNELKELVDQSAMNDKVTFVRSFSDIEKIQLLTMCSVLLYTPSNEHFGICPLEAMYMRRPVIAVCNGGPLETVIDGTTGYLCDPTVDDFSDRMMLYIRDTSLIEKQGKIAREHVINKFSFDAFSSKLDTIVNDLIN